ncbi:hypothetical protein Tco_0030475 [Tanacetum coccineum]
MIKKLMSKRKEIRNLQVPSQPKPKPAIEKSSKPAPAPKPKVTKGKIAKVRNVKSSFQLVAHSEPEPEQEGTCEEYDMERATTTIQMSLESFQA